MTNFFEQGFRPFFLGAGLWAALGMSLWTLIFRGSLEPGFMWSATTWHIHEMLFGYVSAVISGFLLTAVPNWTGIAAPKGARLAGIFVLWISGRLAVFFAGSLPPLFVAVVDISFLIVLEIWLVRTLVRSGNKRNLVVAGFIAILILANMAMHSGAWASFGARFGLLAVIMLISLIGGRVIPAFTRNWLTGEGARHVVPEFGTPDKLALATTAVALILFGFGLSGGVTAAAFLAASLAGFVRLVRWQGKRTTGEPLVWILHLAYLWLPVGYLLIALSQVSDLISATGALHALTTGAIGTMTLAVMTRASLGHSGRPLRANAATVSIYVLVTLAALLRVASDAMADPVLVYSLAGAAWTAAFVVFVAVYGALFLSPTAEQPA